MVFICACKVAFSRCVVLAIFRHACMRKFVCLCPDWACLKFCPAWCFHFHSLIQIICCSLVSLLVLSVHILAVPQLCCHLAIC